MVAFQNKGAMAATIVVAASDSLNKAAANYVCDGVADDVEIQAAIDALPAGGGKVVLLEGNYTIADTVNLPNAKAIKFSGAGFATILTGSVSPLINCPTLSTGKVIISKIKVVTTSNNIGIRAQQTWGASPIASLDINLVWFYAEGSAGELLDIYGVRESSIRNSWFSGATDFGDTDIGINLRGDGSGGAMNISITNCQLWKLSTAIKGVGVSATYFAGLRITNIVVIGCDTPINIYLVNDLIITDSMFDNNHKAIVLDSVRPLRIANNWMAVSSDNEHVLYIKSTAHYSYYSGIINNWFQSIATIKGDGIRWEDTGNHVQYNIITANIFYDLSTAINFIKATKNNQNHIVTDNIFILNNIGIVMTNINNTIITGNLFEAVTTKISGSGTGNKIHDNKGYVTENSGTATVLNTTTSIAVAHGLAATPTRIQITPRENPTNAVSFWWVDTVGAANFTINVNADPGASNLDFDWHAQVGEG